MLKCTFYVAIINTGWVPERKQPVEITVAFFPLPGPSSLATVSVNDDDGEGLGDTNLLHKTPVHVLLIN